MRPLVVVLAALAALSGAPVAPVPATADAPQHRGVAVTAAPTGRCEAGAPTRVAAAAPPVGIGRCRGVRPGAQIIIPKGEDRFACTLNFVFTGRTRSGRTHRYVGTAGHCILADGATDSEGGERRWRAGRGPRVLDANGKRIGEFAYAVLSGERDFALIRVDRGIAVDPQMCHFGGPTGINNDLTGRTTLLQYNGQGLAVGRALPARTAVAKGLPHPDHVFAAGVAIPGDSGSAVTSADGRAVGVLVTTGLHGLGIYADGGVDAGTMGISRLSPQLRRAEAVLGQRLRLRLAPQR